MILLLVLEYSHCKENHSKKSHQRTVTLKKSHQRTVTPWNSQSKESNSRKVAPRNSHSKEQSPQRKVTPEKSHQGIVTPKIYTLIWILVYSRTVTNHWFLMMIWMKSWNTLHRFEASPSKGPGLNPQQGSERKQVIVDKTNVIVNKTDDIVDKTDAIVDKTDDAIVDKTDVFVDTAWDWTINDEYCLCQFPQKKLCSWSILAHYVLSNCHLQCCHIIYSCDSIYLCVWHIWIYIVWPKLLLNQPPTIVR